MKQLYTLPTVGSSGVFTFAAPFNSTTLAGEKLTVKAIRTITELESNNIDVLKTRYIDLGLGDVMYQEHMEIDMHFVTLQSGFGQWVEIPASHILTYPKVDGVAYLRRNIVISLPAFPKEQDIELLEQEIKDIAEDYMGTRVGVKQVELGVGVIYVDEDTHRLKQIERRLARTNIPSRVARMRELEQRNTALANKVALLEQYIISKAI